VTSHAVIVYEIAVLTYGQLWWVLVQFSERFLTEGPGTYGDDLDTGLNVMNSYRKQCADNEARRADLAAAEKLFDLPISVCQLNSSLYHYLICMLASHDMINVAQEHVR